MTKTIHKSQYAKNRISSASVGTNDQPNSLLAGKEAARSALSRLPLGQTPNLAILLSTSRHDPSLISKGVRETLGDDILITGGYSVGIITNDYLGYDGYQVGIALFSFSENFRVDVFLEEGLADEEISVGGKLAKKISSMTYDGDPGLLFLYDSINRKSGNLKFNTATSILEGMSQHFRQWPSAAGAGLVGDMQCRETYQWFQKEVFQQSISAMVFSGSASMRTTILHGCIPVSGYHTVTKSEGNIILEIDDKPAVEVIGELIGPNSGKTWRDYSFFVTLGVNKSDKFSAYDEAVYANRLCMSVDSKRGGLIMFEPDLVPGSQIQLMRRNTDLDYIREKIDSLLSTLGNEKPILAFYIDCAGRASAYSGAETEEASVVQKCLGPDIPLLGFYSGVEVGSVNRKMQALDWSGILCLITESQSIPNRTFSFSQLPEMQDFEFASSSHPENLESDLRSISELKNELQKYKEKAEENEKAKLYYQNRLDTLAGLHIKADSTISTLSHRYKQKEQGFSLLSSLQTFLEIDRDLPAILEKAVEEINSTLNMDRSVFLMADVSEKSYVPVVHMGYPSEIGDLLPLKTIRIPDSVYKGGYLIANRKTEETDFIRLVRSELQLPYFIAVPVVISGKTAGMIFSGRLKEVPPFFPAIDKGDGETFLSLSGVMASLMQNKNLYSSLEEQAKSFERFVPKQFLDFLDKKSIVDVDLGEGVEREMTIMFCDIRSFTSLSEKMTPQEVFRFLNSYLERVGPVIRKHKGFIDKFMGDGFMALFPGDSEDAINASLELLSTVKLYNEHRANSGYSPIKIGAGFHRGNIMLGMIGEEKRMEGTVVADAVNLASRIESLTKKYGASLVTSLETVENIQNKEGYVFRTLDKVTVKGKEKPVTLVEILENNPDDPKVTSIPSFEKALNKYLSGYFREAEAKFRELLRKNPNDIAVDLFVKRCGLYLEQGVPLDWDGVFNFEEK